MMAYENYTVHESLWNIPFPSSWEILPLYAIAKKKSICNNNDLPLLSVYLDVGVVLFSSKDEKRTNVTSQDLTKYQRVDVGDFVLNNQQAWRGSVGISFNTGIVSPAYIVLSIDEKINRRFANYILRSYIMVDQYLINSNSVGSIQRNIHWSELKRVKLPVPPRDEQDQIVRFLDWKVSGINRLIGIKRKQIKRIDSLKRAMVNNAVTHGLNSSIPLKDSGVDWLGKIPTHWKTTKLRKLIHVVSEKNHPELPLLSVVREQGVIVRDIDDKDMNHNYVPDDLSGYKVVRKGQFAMNKMKAWQGSYGISSYTGIVSPAYFVFDVDFDNLDYFHNAIRSKVYVNFFAQASDGIRVGQWDLQIDKMKEIPFIIPPKKEQDEIVSYIEQNIPKNERIIDKLTDEIGILQELKTRLISDTVTGKIDVRNIEIPEYEFVGEEASVEEKTDMKSDENEE